MSERVQITFPVHAYLGGAFEGRTGLVGGVRFENGVAREPITYHVAKGLGAARQLYGLTDGLRLHPLHEGRAWRAEPASRFWNELRAVPRHALVAAEIARRVALILPDVSGDGLHERVRLAVVLARQGIESDGWTPEVEIDAKAPGSSAEGLEPSSATPPAEGGEEAPGEAPGDAGEAAERRLALAMRLLELIGAKGLRQLCQERGIRGERSGREMARTLALAAGEDELEAALRRAAAGREGAG